MFGGGWVGPVSTDGTLRPLSGCSPIGPEGSGGLKSHVPSLGLFKALFNGGTLPPSKTQRWCPAGVGVWLQLVSKNPADSMDKPRHAAVPEKAVTAAGEGHSIGGGRDRERRPRAPRAGLRTSQQGLHSVSREEQPPAAGVSSLRKPFCFYWKFLPDGRHLTLTFCSIA